MNFWQPIENALRDTVILVSRFNIDNSLRPFLVYAVSASYSIQFTGDCHAATWQGWYICPPPVEISSLKRHKRHWQTSAGMISQEYLPTHWAPCPSLETRIMYETLA